MDEQNRAILDAAIAVANEAGAEAILLASALPEETAYLRERVGPDRRVVAAASGEAAARIPAEADLVTLPGVRLRRRGRAKIALLEALAAGLLQPRERVVIISANELDGAARLDTIAIVELNRDDEIMEGRVDDALSRMSQIADPAVFDALLGLCVELGHEGREGRPVGVIVTLGDHEAVLERSRQAVLNPFAGHPEADRNVLNPVARRTLREFSGIDGAFILRGDGVILSAGRYLQELAPEHQVPAGLGARHRAAAGITAATRCISFTVSESTGDTRIWGRGRLLMTIERSD